VNILVTDRNKFRPVDMGINLVWAIKILCPDSLKIRNTAFDKLAGTPQVRLMLEVVESPKKIISSWQNGTRKFENFRKKLLLYR
jgi:uncharacterized protein YbbC (DUF1343 family)